MDASTKAWQREESAFGLFHELETTHFARQVYESTPIRASSTRLQNPVRRIERTRPSGEKEKRRARVASFEDGAGRERGIGDAGTSRPFGVGRGDTRGKLAAWQLAARLVDAGLRTRVRRRRQDRHVAGRRADHNRRRKALHFSAGTTSQACSKMDVHARHVQQAVAPVSRAQYSNRANIVALAKTFPVQEAETSVNEQHKTAFGLTNPLLDPNPDTYYDDPVWRAMVFGCPTE